MTESAPERIGRSLLGSINLLFAILVGVVAAIIYWGWQGGYDRIIDEPWLFRAMWASLVGVAAGSVIWVILESIRPSRQR